ncbi:MFS transporter [Streptomyces sp. MMG1533]|uniref:MFS transporter n=1 Tax=Streptomyces sp. MMG1533 TaxID=1415546 RepID=UPI00099D1925|nr:MFS transporter [Streptomyces sp. MMG1533]
MRFFAGPMLLIIDGLSCSPAPRKASARPLSVEYLLPSTVVSLLAAPVGGQLVRRHGPRVVLALASASGTAGFAWLALDHSRTPSVIVAGALVGAAISLGYVAMPAIIVAAVPQRESGITNGINSISRSTGSAIGSAVITTVLASKSVGHLPAGSPALPAESQFTLSFVLAGAGLRADSAGRLVPPAAHPGGTAPCRRSGGGPGCRDRVRGAAREQVGGPYGVLAR